MIGLCVNDQLNSDDSNALARIKYLVILKREAPMPGNRPVTLYFDQSWVNN